MGRVGPIHLDTYLAVHCIRQERLTEAANRTVVTQARARREREEMGEMRQLTRLQLEALARLLGSMAEEVEEVKPRGQRQQALTFAVGVAARPRRRGDVSGDTPLVARLDRGRVVLGLSDGMGTGASAAVESGTALDLVADMLRAGFSQAMAVRAVNAALLLRSQKEEFATLDLVVLDLERHEAELVKVAAAPSFLRRGGLVRVIQGAAPPVGILRDVRVEPMYHRMQAGDVLVMVSDGVLGDPDAGGEDRLQTYLRDMPGDSADVMAQALLALMLDGRPDEAGALRDDALLMVLTVTEARTQRFVQLGEQVVGEWLRVTPARARGARLPREPGRHVG
jgi:stage II sporulation protein E